MGGGSFTFSFRTEIGQGKGVTRDHEDVWNKTEYGEYDKRIIYRLGTSLLSYHEKLFDNYFREVKIQIPHQWFSKRHGYDLSTE